MVGGNWVNQTQQDQTNPEISMTPSNDVSQNDLITEPTLKNGNNATPPAQASIAQIALEQSYPGLTENSRMVGQQLWNYNVVLNNFQQEPYQLAPHSIIKMVIEDDFLFWPLRGHIVIDNKLESWERSATGKYYHIRSDCRDEIKIKVWPSTESEMPKEVFEMSLDCVVYDVEDMESTSQLTKAKKLYFWDKSFQFLLEKNFQWSTATGTRTTSEACPEPVQHATDTQRSMIVEEAIASLLTDAGFGDIVDTGNWYMSSEKINYTTKPNKTIWENIEYLLSLTLANIIWDRNTKKLQLMTFGDIFGKADNWQLEHLYFEETESSSGVSSFKSPTTDGSMTKDFKSGSFNTIMSYKFSQTSGLDNSLAFTSKPIYSYKNSNKHFNTEFANNDIEYAKNYFQSNITSKMMGGVPVMVLNNTKKENKSIKPSFSPMSNLDTDSKLREVFGFGKIISAAVLLNQSMHVRLKGATNRLSCRFVGVDRLTQSSDTNYDYAVCGQYFVVNVKHIIQNQKYVTDLTMIKTHSYSALKNNEGII